MAVLPSSDMSTEVRRSFCVKLQREENTATMELMQAPSSSDHTFAVLSSDTEITLRPSLEQAMERTGPAWPLKHWRHSPLVVHHRLMLRSAEAVSTH
jgi:hypothetical protein